MRNERERERQRERLIDREKKQREESCGQIEGDTSTSRLIY